MTPQIQAWVKKAKKDFIKTPGRVLEIGSLNINGSVREYFIGSIDYIGIDSVKGLGVDKVLNSHNILREWGANSFNTVLCLEMLEHDDKPWITIENIKEVLKKGGFLIISTPTFGFPLHRYPKDYFRFGEDAFKEFFFKGIKILRLSLVKDNLGSPGICCIGQK